MVSSEDSGAKGSGRIDLRNERMDSDRRFGYALQMSLLEI